MKARILMEFRDKDNFDKIYRQGDIIEVTRERYQELKALELAKEVRDREQLDKSQELKALELAEEVRDREQLDKSQEL